VKCGKHTNGSKKVSGGYLFLQPVDLGCCNQGEHARHLNADAELWTIFNYGSKDFILIPRRFGISSAKPLIEEIKQLLNEESLSFPVQAAPPHIAIIAFVCGISDREHQARLTPELKRESKDHIKPMLKLSTRFIQRYAEVGRWMSEPKSRVRIVDGKPAEHFLTIAKEGFGELGLEIDRQETEELLRRV